MKKTIKKPKLEASDLFKKIIKQKTLKSGTVVLCYLSMNFCSVLVYDDIGRLIASRCLDIGYTRHVRTYALKSLNKIYNEFKNMLIARDKII